MKKSKELTTIVKRATTIVERAVEHASLKPSNEDIISYLENKGMRDIEEALDGMRFTIIRLREGNWYNDKVAEKIVEHIINKYKEK